MADVLPLRSLVAEPLTTAPLLVGAKQLHPRLSVGLRTLRSMDAAGKLPKPLRLGGKVLWNVAEIEAWIEAGCPDRETWEARRASRK